MKHRLAFLMIATLVWTSSLAQERVKFTLDWVIDGQQTPFLLTQGRGHFRERSQRSRLQVTCSCRRGRPG